MRILKNSFKTYRRRRWRGGSRRQGPPWEAVAIAAVPDWVKRATSRATSLQEGQSREMTVNGRTFQYKVSATQHPQRWQGDSGLEVNYYKKLRRGR